VFDASRTFSACKLSPGADILALFVDKPNPAETALPDAG